MNQNQRTRKGFTLIEMLVVIAVIAVLVSIAIPSVMDYSNKAACVTNAANLRAIQSEVTMAYQRNDDTDYTFTLLPDGGIETRAIKELPAAKKTSSPDCSAGAEMKIEFTPNPFEFYCTFNGLKVEDFAAGAEGNYVPTP